MEQVISSLGTSWTNGKLTAPPLSSQGQGRDRRIIATINTLGGPEQIQIARIRRAQAAFRQKGQRNENLSTTPSAAELDDLAEEGPLSKTKLQFYKEGRISLQTIRRPSVTEVYGNASFSPRHMENQDLAPSRHATWKQKKAAIYLYTL